LAKVGPLLLVAIGSGLLYLWAYGRPDRRWEWFLKPLTTGVLIMIGLVGLWSKAATADAATGGGRYGPLMLLGLCLSLAGDIFLMLPRDRFLQGLGAFLLAHLAYSAAFWGRAPVASLSSLVAALVLLGLGLWLFALLAQELRRRGTKLLVAVGLYVLVIIAMVWRAVATQVPLVVAGALLFLLSDALLGLNRFYRKIPWAQGWIMLTYWGGQALLALSIGQA
jgi:uncharacterized membrane protein YhhN